MAKKPEKNVGAPPWMVTFADLMALLLTMFVLLLSFSTMDVDRYKKIAGAMSESFGLSALTRLSGMIEVEGFFTGKHIKQVAPKAAISIDLPDVIGETPMENEALEALPDEMSEDQMADEAIQENLRRVLASVLDGKQISIEESGDQTIITFTDEIAFPAGSERLAETFLPTMDKLISVLAEAEGQIIVAGHTDDRPISTARFRSNWDLSTARAVSVVHQILKSGKIAPERVTAQGYADSRPLVANDSPENRALNRRVEISIRKR
jgi:chemotaxis protein MotB